ncbi:hypothetical protein HN415_01265 [Candidatus Woesearchaeota archaeon]|nr:hypothetical protein [Candidatus Woesearchaeota archaeon]
MEESEINITYETLYELFRREKKREELQELNKTFFKDLVEYINTKKQMMSSTGESDNFTPAQKQKSMMQFENIKKILKELYEKRERKIISIALNKSRTGSDIINIKILLDEEKLLYDDLLNLFNNYREGIQNNLIAGLMPKMVIKNIKNDQLKESSESKTVDDSSNLPSENESLKTTKMVRFIQGVPKFVGKELETYGPFDKDDIATLPIEIASILIKKGRAEAISSS